MTDWKPPASAHSQYMTLTCSRYNAMRKRIEGKQDKLGRRLGLRMQVPFTLKEFREWVLQQLQGSEEGTCRCGYCGAWLTIHNMVVDHIDPPSRGGGLGLDNLIPACEPCNDRKGETRAKSFVYLIKCMENIAFDDAANYMGRLAKAEKLAATNRRNQARFAAATKPQKETETTIDQF